MSAAEGNTESNGAGQEDRPRAVHCAASKRAAFAGSAAMAGPLAVRINVSAKIRLMHEASIFWAPRLERDLRSSVSGLVITIATRGVHMKRSSAITTLACAVALSGGCVVGPGEYSTQVSAGVGLAPDCPYGY